MTKSVKLFKDGREWESSDPVEVTNLRARGWSEKQPQLKQAEKPQNKSK